MANKYDLLIEELRGYYWAPNQKSVIPGEKLIEVEKALGSALPADFREFIRDYDGISFEGVAFPFEGVAFPLAPNPDIWADRYLGMFCGFGVNAKGLIGSEYLDRTWDTSEMPGIKLVKEIDSAGSFNWPQELLPIAETPGGTPICLAVGGLRPGAIFIWFNNENYGQNVYLVADSFDEFMESLYLEC